MVYVAFGCAVVVSIYVFIYCLCKTASDADAHINNTKSEERGSDNER